MLLSRGNTLLLLSQIISPERRRGDYESAIIYGEYFNGRKHAICDNSGSSPDLRAKAPIGIAYGEDVGRRGAYLNDK